MIESVLCPGWLTIQLRVECHDISYYNMYHIIKLNQLFEKVSLNLSLIKVQIDF